MLNADCENIISECQIVVATVTASYETDGEWVMPASYDDLCEGDRIVSLAEGICKEAGHLAVVCTAALGAPQHDLPRICSLILV